MYKQVKRFLDVIFSIIGASILLPLFVIVSIIIKIDSPGPIFYLQSRVGMGGKPFKIIKFRSMKDNSDFLGWSTHINDERITAFGAIIRKTSIDELPQLINVIKGDMSLVGPRPDVPEQLSLYKKTDLLKRLEVRPGITGLAQVRGRSQITAEDRLKNDLEYVENNSLLLDFKIIFQTFVQIFRSNNAW